MPKPEQPRQIFLGNISYDATPSDVVNALREAGIAAARVRIATHRDTGAPRGFGFLDLEPGELRSTQEVIERINLYEIPLHGRVLRADMVKERPPRDAPGKPKARGTGRGHARNEFQRGKSEFDWGDD